MTLCIVTGRQCVCQPDEAMWCPDYKPDRYTQYLMQAIVELRAENRAALEQAAKVCADYAEHLHKNGAGWYAGHIIAEECERKIRALLEPSDG